MAQKIILSDDIDGSEDGVTTHTFSLDASTFSIDLSAANLDKITKALQPFIAAARPGGSSGRQVTPIQKAGGTRKRASSGAAAAGVDLPALREWAAKNKVDLPTRGRIPKATVDQYLAATGS